MQHENNELEGLNLDSLHQSKKLKPKLAVTEVRAEKVAHKLKERSKRFADALTTEKKKKNKEQQTSSKAMMHDQQKKHAKEKKRKGIAGVIKTTKTHPKVAKAKA